jgi:vacuolar fusion protein MON1
MADAGEEPSLGSKQFSEESALGADASLTVAGGEAGSPSIPYGSGSSEGTPPPLPPRRMHSSPESARRSQSPESSLKRPTSVTRASSASGPVLQSKATTALSLADGHGQGSEYSSPSPRQLNYAGVPRGASRRGSDADETMSVRSLAPTTTEAGIDVESMLGEVLNRDNPAWRSVTPRANASRPEDALFLADPEFQDAFEREFDELDDITSDGLNEDAVLNQWKSKLKQYFILSRAGKPIWSRHGNDQLVTSYVGVILTLISFYEGGKDALKGFTAEGARFVVLSKGSLHLLAISRLGESDQQLRAQLEALYMQILSTLTLPVMEKMFQNRASTDLRRPLQGTEKLLSALADGFTRGSPLTLLSALECLKMRKAHRNTINNTLLKTRSANLLYGLIVAGGRLVSVVRPRKHSLHPGDLHLIFNMLFEAGSVKAGGGENWIPLCLPGFNNTGYLYMYVSFLNLDDPSGGVEDRPSSSHAGEDEVAIVLISADKEGFFDLQQTKVDLIEVRFPLNA